MLVNIYSIFDSKAGAYLQFWPAANHQIAFRSIEKALRNPQSPLAEFPHDYNLFHIGSFNEITGSIVPVEPVPISLGLLTQFMPDGIQVPAASSVHG